MPKDAMLPDLAKWFQEPRITTLLFDPRGLGASNGHPRNDVSFVGLPTRLHINRQSCTQIDARQQAEDLHYDVT